MKIIFSILFLLLVSFYGMSQLIVNNLKMNILYAGVDNPIQFSFPGYDIKKLKLVADYGQIIKIHGQYIWKICGNKFHGRVTFSCFYLGRKKKKLIGTSEYRIKRLPDPRIIIASDDNLNHKVLYYGPRADLVSSDFDIRFRVKRFKVEIDKANGDTIRLINNQERYTQEVLDSMNKLSTGDIIYFYDFAATSDCDNGERELTDKLYYHYTEKYIPSQR